MRFANEDDNTQSKHLHTLAHFSHLNLTHFVILLKISPLVSSRFQVHCYMIHLPKDIISKTKT